MSRLPVDKDALTFARPQLSYAAAATLVDAVVQRAGAQQLAVSVAILDGNGTLKAFAGMDAAPAISREACQRKAATALLGLPSGQLAGAVANDAAMLASFSGFPSLTLLGGGLPIFAKGLIIGAIGVGGAQVDQDEALAAAAIDEVFGAAR